MLHEQLVLCHAYCILEINKEHTFHEVRLDFGCPKMIEYWLTNIIHQKYYSTCNIPNIAIASTLLIQPFVVRQIDSFKLECVWTLKDFLF
jgi:hypothetical protein